MRKKIKLKYKKERVVLSDILPYEIPFIFSNRYFYRFLVSNKIRIEDGKLYWKDNVHDGLYQFLRFMTGSDASIMKQNGFINIGNVKDTIPFKYNILHKPSKLRELSIIHPFNQILMVDFYNRYKDLILYYCNLDKFSLRHPHKVASYFYYRDRLHSSLIGKKADSLELFFNEYENLRTFFSYKRYDNIYKFYEDYRYQRAEKKFSKLLKFDIQSCFDSIYSHSISWALGGGKDIYKESFISDKKIENSFPEYWDKLMQRMNYGETNGIVIGPEFSRIFAEVILQYIDRVVLQDLTQEKIIWDMDFVCYRYVDDYFLFFNDDQIKDCFFKILAQNLNEFKLRISDAKTIEYERPFITNITQAKLRIDQLISDEIRGALNINIQNDDVQEEPSDINSEISEPNEALKSRIETVLTEKLALHLNSRHFITEFKALQKECGVESKDIINYTLSRIAINLERLLRRFDKSYRILAKGKELVSDLRKEITIEMNKRQNKLATFLQEFIDIVFFLYASNKRVNTTLKIIDILNIIHIHMNNDYHIDNKAFPKYNSLSREGVFKKIQDEIGLIFKTTKLDANAQIETLYFLIFLKSMRSKYHLPSDLLDKFINSIPNLNALSIIILLYYIGNEKQYGTIKEKIIQSAKSLLQKNRQRVFGKSAEMCILALDLFCCPYIKKEEKWEFAKTFSMKKPELDALLDFLGKHKFMFTKWTGVNLTKELNAKISQEVYS